jgi:hypothetical protein
MMLNINLDYDCIMGDGATVTTKRQSSLMCENKFVITIWAGVSSNDALPSPARTKRLLRRLNGGRLKPPNFGLCAIYQVTGDVTTVKSDVTPIGDNGIISFRFVLCFLIK